MPKSATFRFYEELNDFLPDDLRKRPFRREFSGKPTVKDTIEAIGVPHTEIDLILVNGVSAGFGHHLNDGDTVSVYPMFESLDISPIIRLRPQPLRTPRFICDVHLGKLARYLRMLGFDTLYRNDYADPEIVDISVNERRAVLTRDTGILKYSRVTHGYRVRETDPHRQLEEVAGRFSLRGLVKPFTRCMNCNGRVQPVDKDSISYSLEENTKRYYDEFYRCENCGNVYWKGSHYEKMRSFIDGLG